MVFFPKAENFVTFLKTHNCARPWFVWVGTFAPAFLKLWLTISFLDPEDIIRARGKMITAGRPSPSGRGLGHLRKGRYATISNQVNSISHNGLKTLLWVTEPLEKIGFLWLLYSASEQFFYDWQTGLMKSSYCTDFGLAGPFQRSRPGGSNVPISPTGSVTPLGTLEQNRANWVNTGVSVTLPPGFYTCVFALTVRGPNGGITGVAPQLRVTGNLGPSIIKGDTGDLSEGQANGFTVEADLIMPLGGVIVWELSGPAVPVGLTCDLGTVICWATG